MTPKKTSRRKKARKKKSSGKGKIVLIIILIALIGFSGWTFPTTTTVERSYQSITDDYTMEFDVRFLHNKVVVEVVFNGTGASFSVTVIDPDGTHVYNYTEVVFNGKYTVQFSYSNAKPETWRVTISVLVASVDVTITAKSMGGFWAYIF